ncbi:MAG: O-acetyl-ADP-ribose deacetylase [Candidatus Syntrophosphaera sp.]
MIHVLQGDITKFEGDAIVNAANRSLLGGGGVDGAIHHAAGPELLEECRRLGGCATGDAKITFGYRLPARYVIHAVGPVWRGGKENEEELLASCYRRSLELAKKKGLRSIAFPNISTGIYNFPKHLAGEIAIRTVKEFLTGDHALEVYFYCFDSENYGIYRKILQGG